jgi:hypothetical protein
MSHSVTVDLQCPRCDDGVLTATCSPDSIDDLTDAGCGHAGELNWLNGPDWQPIADLIWQAVAAKEYDAYLDAQDSRFSAWRDR